MYRTLTLFLVVALAASARSQNARQGKGKLDGTWAVVSMERDGKVRDQAKEDRITFAGDKMTIKSPNREEHATLKLDPGKTPREIDITPSEGPQKDKAIKGIYALKGDELRICFPGNPTGDRPKELTGKEGSGQVLVVLKRVNP